MPEDMMLDHSTTVVTLDDSKAMANHSPSARRDAESSSPAPPFSCSPPSSSSRNGVAREQETRRRPQLRRSLPTRLGRFGDVCSDFQLHLAKGGEDDDDRRRCYVQRTKDGDDDGGGGGVLAGGVLAGGSTSIDRTTSHLSTAVGADRVIPTRLMLTRRVSDEQQIAENRLRLFGNSEPSLARANSVIWEKSGKDLEWSPPGHSSLADIMFDPEEVRAAITLVAVPTLGDGDVATARDGSSPSPSPSPSPTTATAERGVGAGGNALDFSSSREKSTTGSMERSCDSEGASEGKGGNEAAATMAAAELSNAAHSTFSCRDGTRLAPTPSNGSAPVVIETPKLSPIEHDESVEGNVGAISVDSASSGGLEGEGVATTQTIRPYLPPPPPPSPAHAREMSLHEILLERELTGLNDEFSNSKTKLFRRASASVSLSSVTMRPRQRSGSVSSSTITFYDSVSAASIAAGHAGGGHTAQFVAFGDWAIVSAKAGEATAVHSTTTTNTTTTTTTNTTAVENSSDQQIRTADWFERRKRRPLEQMERGCGTGDLVSMGGKDWREVLIDGIAGFGKHAPLCVLGDVAAFVREAKANDDERRQREEVDVSEVEGPAESKDIETVAEAVAPAEGYPVKEKEAGKDESCLVPHAEETTIEDKSVHNSPTELTEETTDDEEELQSLSRRPLDGVDRQSTHCLQIGPKSATIELDISHPSVVLDNGNMDVAGSGLANESPAASNQSSGDVGVEHPLGSNDCESVLIQNMDTADVQMQSLRSDGDAQQSGCHRLDRRASDESSAGNALLRFSRRGSTGAVLDERKMNHCLNRRSSLGSPRRSSLRGHWSNWSANASVVSDDTTVQAGHKSRRGSAESVAVALSPASTWPHKNIGSDFSRLRCRTTFDLPHYSSRDSALLFVDISGFTKLSTLLDIEDLSHAINSYFDLIVAEVLSYGGDVLKFAGDALFAEWQATRVDESDDEFTECSEDDADSEETWRRKLSGDKQSTESWRLVCNTNGKNAAKNNSADMRNKRSSEGRTLAECVMAAAFCGASICRKCSGYKVYSRSDEAKNLRSQRSSVGGRKKRNVAKLNVHCGIGAGQMVGLHVSNARVMCGREPTENRREFLFLGDPIDQVAKAEGIAQIGELVASPEVARLLAEVCIVPESISSCDEPSVIARRSECFFSSKIPWEPLSLAFAAGPLAAGYDLAPYESLDAMCDNLDSHTLEVLRDQLSLYVHPVVRCDEFSKAEEDTLQPLSQEQQRAEAELRSVYVMFITPLISAHLSGDPDIDRQLYTTLSDIMNVTHRELVKFRGHLRQFIVDDKGVVLIGTFGLRGSTFPNMVTENALPATLSIHQALKCELNVDNKIGATFGKVYCGVVGGVHRHEFAVLGPSVNLAARLMALKENTGVLVDNAVQCHAKDKFSFRSHSLVTAKGYAKPVPTFEPLDSINQKIDDSIGIVGRMQEIKQVMDVTRKIIEVATPIPSQLVFLGGESGVGKTALIGCLVEKIKTFCALYYKYVAICRSSSRENEQLVPLSGFKDVFLHAILEYCMFDGTITKRKRRNSLNSLKRSTRRLRHSSKLRRRDNFTSQVSTMEAPCINKLRWVCEDLGYNLAYADIVGARLLGLDEADATVCTVDGEVPKLEKIIDFLADAIIRFTRHSGVTLITIDDVQWIDGLSWKVIHALWQKGEDMLIIGGVRDCDHGGKRRRLSASDWDKEDKGSRFVSISLGPLERDDMKTLISKALYCHESSIDDKFVNKVRGKTGGIPVFALELLENIKRNDLVEVQETGLLGLKIAQKSEQGKFETQGPGVVDELFLQRFDALDLPVRKVLQSCAVLGIDFLASDVLRVNPEYESAEVLWKALDSAVAERILVEDVENGPDEDSLNGQFEEMNDVPLLASPRSTFRFSQAMWRDIILRTMLKDRQMNLHRVIANAIEADGVSECSDTRTLLKLFGHWKACCDFLKAAPLALAIGARLEEWESSQHSLDLYCSALAMWSTDTKVNVSLETLGAWYEPSLSSDALAFVVRLKTRVGKCLSNMGDEKKGALAYRDAYLMMTKLPASKRVDRSLLFPVISGLWSSIPWDQIDANDRNFSVEHELVQRFVDEAQEYGDPIHCCRALAMQCSLCSRTSDFSQALEVQRQLEQVYSFDEHSAGIFEAYGSDFAALSFGASVQWYDLVGEEDMARKQSEFVLNRLLPMFHPTAIHDSMGVLFPVLMLMKSKCMAKDAIVVFQKYVLDRFKALGIKSTYFYPLYKPTSFLLELARRDESKDDTVDGLLEIESWALKDERISSIPSLERNGTFLQGEICWRLARRKSHDDPLRAELIKIASSLLKWVMKKVQHDGSYSFMVKEAYYVYTDLQVMKDMKLTPAPQAEAGCSCTIS